MRRQDDGALHEFQTLPDVVGDNRHHPNLKDVSIKMHDQDAGLRASRSRPKERVTAADIQTGRGRDPQPESPLSLRRLAAASSTPSWWSRWGAAMCPPIAKQPNMPME